MSLLDLDSFYIGISENDYQEITRNGNDISVVIPERSAFDIFESFISGTAFDYENDKARAYRLGNGAYFVHDFFLFARKYSNSKSYKDGCGEVVLQISIRDLLVQSGSKLINLLCEADHYFFYNTIHKFKETFTKLKGDFGNNDINSFNLDAVVFDYLIYETKDKDCIKISGVVALIQEPYRTTPYTNDILQSSDFKTANPNRLLTGIRPLDHVEVMVTKEYCKYIQIVKVNDDKKISERLDEYLPDFLQRIGAI